MQSIGKGNRCFKSAPVLFRISAVAAVIVMFIFVMMPLITAVLPSLAALQRRSIASYRGFTLL